MTSMVDPEVARLRAENRQLRSDLDERGLALESQLRALFDFMPQLGWTAQPDGSIDFYNRGWYEYTGTTFEEMKGWAWKSVHHAEMLPRVIERWESCLRAGTPFEMEFPLRRRDGAFRWFLTRVNPVRDADGVIRRWVGINTDIDDQRNHVEQEVGRFFAMSLDLLCIVGLDGFFKRLNPLWSAILGWTDEELVSKPWLDFVHPDDRGATAGAGSQLNEGASVISFTNRYVCKDGSYRWLEWRARPDGERGMFYAAARDITPRREAEDARDKLREQLIVSDRMASAGTLAAGVAHEINNPLGYMTVNLDMVLEEIRALAGGSSSGRMRELEGMILDARDGAERVRKIVRGMKTFSRVDEESRAVLDVKPVIELSINMAFNEIRHRARLVEDFGEIPLVYADDARLAQVFINLLVNAAQAIPEGNVDSNEIRIRTSTDPEGRAVVEVVDTGPGIPDAVLGRMFDAFFTTKAVGAGTGLGLSICHNIVTGLGGDISVTSELGRGTAFRVVLPAAAVQQLPGARALVTPTAPMTRRGAVLVLDDEPPIRVALARVLGDHEVTTVATAMEALALIRSGKHFDIILSDLMMPQMTGMDFYDELAQSSPEDAAKIVFISGGAFTPRAREFLERVANERIEKPFDVKTVRELVRNFLK